MKVSFILNCGLCSKTGKWVLSRKRENGKPDIVLKTVKGFDIKRTPFTFFIRENSLNFGIGVLVMIYKILVIVFTIDFYFKYGPRC